MTLQIEETLADLAIDDYFLGTDGETIWKVVRKRSDGYIGITNKAGEKVIVKPEHADTRVTQVIFGVDTLEELEARAVDTVKEVLGAKVVEWVMPSLATIYDDAIQLKAHLHLHHGKATGDSTNLEHLRDEHDVRHTFEGDDAPDHTHEEK